MITTDNFNLEYVYSGVFSTEQTWIHPEKTEITYELIYVISGDVFIEENNQRYHLRKNDAIVLKPGISHKGYLFSSPPVSFYWIHFHTDNFEGINIKTNYIKNFTDSSMFKKLLHVANSSNYPNYSQEAVLLNILNELAAFTLHSKEDYKFIRDAAEWIRINSHTKIYIEDIASKYMLNPQYFSKLFKRYYSIGLKEYISIERMNMAKNLLCNTSYSIKEISFIMNFENENEFINYFKYHQNQTPTKFRNSLSNTHMNNK